MDPMLDFTGKVALITGAASGFGKLLAAELGKRGARLVLGDINMDALDKLAADLEGQGVTGPVAPLRRLLRGGLQKPWWTPPWSGVVVSIWR